MESSTEMEPKGDWKLLYESLKRRQDDLDRRLKDQARCFDDVELHTKDLNRRIAEALIFNPHSHFLNALEAYKLTGFEGFAEKIRVNLSEPDVVTCALLVPCSLKSIPAHTLISPLLLL